MNIINAHFESIEKKFKKVINEKLMENRVFLKLLSESFWHVTLFGITFCNFFNGFKISTDSVFLIQYWMFTKNVGLVYIY